MGMNIEEEIKYLKIDFNNLRKELSEVKREFDREIDFFRKNLQVIFDKNQINLRRKIRCHHCEGRGNIYISPISDMGQSNECQDCHGEGVIWI